MKTKNLAFVVALLLCVSAAVQAQTLTVMTEDWPPFNVEVNGKASGLSCDVVNEIMVRNKEVLPIVFLPWARALNNINTQKMQVLFSTAMNDERKPLYKWVGPIASMNESIFAKKPSKFKVKVLADAKVAKSVGVAIGSASNEALTKAGFTNISAQQTSDALVQMLMADRLDLVLTSAPSFYEAARKNKIDTTGIEEVLIVNSLQLYIAFSIDVPDATVAKWKASFDSMVKDGTYAKIVVKYLGAIK